MLFSVTSSSASGASSSAAYFNAPGASSSNASLSVSGGSTSGALGIPDDLDQSNTADVTKEPDNVSTPHLNPEWLKNLKQNFCSIVIDRSSEKVKIAVENNSKFEKAKDHREVRLAIIHGALDHISEVFGGVGRPKLAQMREVASEMGSVYSNMFKEESLAKGYGLGGNKGLDGLANQMLDMLRNREGSRKKKSEVEENPVKKGKRKLVYGKYLYFSV